MKAITKFNIGDTVFFMDNNRIQSGEIRTINITVMHEVIVVINEIWSHGWKFDKRDQACYISREKLIESL